MWDYESATWKTWTIGGDLIPDSLFVQADTPGRVELTLTLLDEITLEPLLGRPLRDTIMFTLREPLA
ncbi:MAG: hypothetical protein A2V70_19980 [Planctomycetes bacterium RBG_13_63_9]|nr:MAG: hypothetical protein A2V70_19980 [Planctomycetes bacterium RBG_13_63_9]